MSVATRALRAPYVHWAITLWPASLLMLSGVTHVQSIHLFLSTIHSYRLVNQAAAEVAAAWLPFLQLAIGAGLLFPGRLYASSMLLGFCLFVAYAAIQVATLARGLNIACGCFGGLQDSPIGVRSIAVPSTAAAMILFAIFLHARRTRLGRLPGPSSSAR